MEYSAGLGTNVVSILDFLDLIIKLVLWAKLVLLGDTLNIGVIFRCKWHHLCHLFSNGSRKIYTETYIYTDMFICVCVKRERKQM